MKWAGAGIILALSLYLGLAAAWEEKRHVRSLAAFCRLLSAVREEVSVLRLPGKEIFAHFHDPFLESVGFLRLLRGGNGGSKGENPDGEDSIPYTDTVSPLTAALSHPEMLRRLALEKDEYETLLSFARGFGTGDSTQESARCSEALLRLQSALSRAEGDAPGNIRILRAVSVSGGILLVLLLV